MAVVQMARIRLCAMRRDRKRMLELLQRRGTVEIRDVGEEDGVFEKEDTSRARSTIEKSAETAARAVEILDKYCPVKSPMFSFLRGRKAVSVEENDAFYKKDEKLLRYAQRIVQQERNIAEAKAEELRNEALEEALLPWMKLPVPQTFTGTRKTSVFIGSVSGAKTLEELLEALVQANPERGSVYIEIVNTSRDQTYFYAMVLKKDAAAMEEALRQIGFTRPAGPSHRMPEVKRARLQEKQQLAREAAQKAEQAIVDLADKREEFRFLEDHLRMRAEKYEMIDRLVLSKHTFILEGYVPRPKAKALRKELKTKFECAVELTAVERTEDTPVLLQDNWFASPTESVLASYSLPGKDDVDPLPVMSIFYYVMFGLMFSDAGYGAIMVALTGFALWRFKNMEPNWKENLWMFFWCGVSTMFWGFMFGSFFGDAIGVISNTFFSGRVALKPVWLDPLLQPMTLLLFCLGIGILHLTSGLALKGVTLFRHKQYPDIVYDVAFPLMIVYPLVLMLMGAELFKNMSGFMFHYPPFVSTLLWVIIGIGCVGLVLTGGRESKNWGKRLLKGIYALYNIFAGWLGDILSYSRLLALGLATGVIASVMNTMGSMPANGLGGIGGALAFIVIFLAGHALNFGINVLGAYVHSNRLEFVEFFGKFYEGGGQKFNPFGMHTKYYKIEEETQNV